MSVTLVFKKTRAKIGAIELDAAVSEQHVSEVEVTEHPVEAGANIVDHRRPKPDVITIDGLITNTPLQDSGPLTRVISNGVAFDSRSELVPARAGQAYQDLLDLKESTALITVVTSLRSYDDMQIVSLSVPRDAKTGQALRFSATLKQIRIATTRAVKLDPKAGENVDLGKKAAPPTPEQTRRQSFLFQANDATHFGDKALRATQKFLGALGK